MTEFRIVQAVPLDVEETWRRVTDWPRHGASVPFTRLDVDADGRRLVARTGIGRFGFDDVMDVVRWEPPRDGGPGRCRLVKRGRAVTGWAEIEVRPLRDGTGSAVRWREDLRFGPLPALLDRPTAWVGRIVFRQALRALLR
ncbi:SRPBCC family protein [Kitasatospora sp. NPDC088391]|uniref:SRPBCC family protein n=1 Tax=Kitasatospora sp. NPDC088391 TaxID=3364074 RepID=UPI003817ADD3